MFRKEKTDTHFGIMLLKTSVEDVIHGANRGNPADQKLCEMDRQRRRSTRNARPHPSACRSDARTARTPQVPRLTLAALLNFARFLKSCSFLSICSFNPTSDSENTEVFSQHRARDKELTIVNAFAPPVDLVRRVNYLGMSRKATRHYRAEAAAAQR